MINIAKTKACKPDRRVGYYTLNYETGIDKIADTIEVALKYGIINQAGAWFNFVDIETGEIMEDDTGELIKLQGKPNVIEYLKENEYLFTEIYNKIKSLIN